ncbi:MAG TPA: hypothetical protein VG028_13925 [Terriglobia bacterium]|nr:hypothetical protein [Terriglobia bacterium]
MNLKQKHPWILIGLLTVAGQVTPAPPQGGRPPANLGGATAGTTARLVEIRFVGSKRYSEAEIIRAVGLKMGAEMTTDSFQVAANKLAATGVFASVRYKYHPTSTGISAEFQVSDARKFIPCKFDNFVWFSADELQKELRARVPLYIGEVPPAGNLADQITAKLEALLKERGVQGTIIQRAAGRLGGPVEAILFTVQGVSIQIARVEFQGTAQVDLALLQGAVQPLLGTDYSRSFVSDFARLNRWSGLRPKRISES